MGEGVYHTLPAWNRIPSNCHGLIAAMTLRKYQDESGLLIIAHVFSQILLCNIQGGLMGVVRVVGDSSSFRSEPIYTT